MINWSIFGFTPISGNLELAVITFCITSLDNLNISVSANGWKCETVPENAAFNLDDDSFNNPDLFEPPVISAEFDYEINNSEVAITGCEPNSFTEIVIPQTIEGYPVTEISGNAFAHCSQITRVVVPEGVTKIGYSAFTHCSRLAEITLPESLVNIEASAFYTCGSLDNVVIPDGVTEIAEYTFYDCQNLKNITLPKNLKSIGKSAFSGSGLETVEIPQSVTFIDSGAFIATGLKKVIIPEGITAIHSSTFKGCKNLVEVIIPDSVVSIGSDAFFGCSSMKSITIPAAVTEIGYMAVGYGENYFPINLFKIYGYKDSKAESYAASNRIGFVAVDADPDEGKYDVNRDGKVTAADARLALRCSAKLEKLDVVRFIAADVNNDNKVTAADARKILRKAAGLD